MVRKSDRGDLDRHLVLRGGNYHYKRRVPAVVADADDRAPHVRMSLKTSDLAVARAKRDAFEAADNHLWTALLSGDGRELARARHQSAVRRAEALGFSYKTSRSLASDASVDELVRRVESVLDERMPKEMPRAVLGYDEPPGTSIGEALDLYVSEIVADELVGKSQAQRHQWEKVKRRAVDNFIEVVGDKDMAAITREDALAIYNFWLQRIAPKGRRGTHSASSGNRDIGNLRKLYEAYFSHIGQSARLNPFARLSFSDGVKRSRPPFETGWIVDRLMAPAALASMNDQARGVTLAMIETGARPSELGNLHPGAILLDHEIPHIRIEPRVDLVSPREIKTRSSVRKIPLVGVALAVFQKHPDGFPRYKDREASMATAINKFLRVNNLLPTLDHSLYCLRHSFEDRMKEAGLDEELRRMLMGHTIGRPKYGSGGSLRWQRDELIKIALPFDPAIV